MQRHPVLAPAARSFAVVLMLASVGAPGCGMQNNPFAGRLERTCEAEASQINGQPVATEGFLFEEDDQVDSSDEILDFLTNEGFQYIEVPRTSINSHSIIGLIHDTPDGKGEFIRFFYPTLATRDASRCIPSPRNHIPPT